MLHVVKTECGMVRGTQGGDPRIMVFRGIPYAAPPVGALRWRSPQPHEPWQGLLEADAFRPMAMQDHPGIDPKDFYTKEIHPAAADYPMDEDCLYLNIWTPALHENEKLPVLFYIHGGGFLGGYSYELEFDGEHVARNGVILVTVGYRLGVFGFMAHPQLAAEQAGQPQGNQGLEDQLAALHWVRRNIAAFGGDPQRITIAGQSAGGMSVQCLLTSPLAKGAMQGAIMMSSGGIAPEGMGIEMNRSIERAYADGQALLDQLGVSTLEEARRMKAEAILKAGLALQEQYRTFLWTPTIDQTFLLTDSRTALLEGRTDDIPCLIGACRTESIPSPARMPAYSTLESFRTFVQDQMGEEGEAYFQSLGLNSDDDLHSLVQTDEAFAGSVATRAFAIRQWQDGKKTYVYLFDHDIPGDNSGSFHGSDLWFVFDSLGRCWRPFRGKHYDLARKVSAYWANFVKYGHPNGTDRFGEALPQWEPYIRENPFVMTFRDQPEADTRQESRMMQHMLTACLHAKEDIRK